MHHSFSRAAACAGYKATGLSLSLFPASLKQSYTHTHTHTHTHAGTLKTRLQAAALQRCSKHALWCMPTQPRVPACLALPRLGYQAVAYTLHPKGVALGRCLGPRQPRLGYPATAQDSAPSMPCAETHTDAHRHRHTQTQTQTDTDTATQPRLGCRAGQRPQHAQTDRQTQTQTHSQDSAGQRPSLQLVYDTP